MAAFPLVPIVTGIAAVGTVVQGYQAYQGAKFQEDVAKQDAAIARQKSQIEQERIKRETRRRIGSIRAAAGASGVVATEGSPLLAQLDQAFEGMLDQDIVRFNGQVAQNAAQARASQARSNQFGAILNTGANLLDIGVNGPGSGFGGR